MLFRSVDVARCLVEELGAAVAWRNKEGQTAEERLSEDADFISVAAYLRQAMARAGALSDASAAARTEPLVVDPMGSAHAWGRYNLVL